ncbi:uncharacterized protein LOC110828981 isoform X2 [Zootermopsis nevadensis]|uniref:uncharacterized protein LOC110828981 isoform X2 n=1 Tax=Zootermopsis nevadensis TaxID=136037 RepID=UPI000B8EE6D3|nr:uncharacterized protein LOC110828981 isoform X2 [Zootermopsis nevadensis]
MIQMECRLDALRSSTIDNNVIRTVCRMYDISELEGMKFKELKRLAREKNISRRWTCKREIIDQIMSTGQDQNLDNITLTLVDSPDSMKSSSGPEVCNEDGLCAPRQSAAKAAGTKKREQPRFQKLRMTVFQQHEGDSSISGAESSHKRNQQYFCTPGKLRGSKVNETCSSSTAEDASEVVSSRKKKSLAHNFAVSGVTYREHRRPVTRSYKNRFPSSDMSEITDECYPGLNSTENFDATRGNERSSTTSSARISHETRRKNETIDNLKKINLNPRESFKGKKLIKSSISDSTGVPEKEMAASSSRKRQFNIFRGVKETSYTGMEGAHSEQSSPKSNFNETFEIQNESTKSDVRFPLEDNIKEQGVQPNSLNSAGGKTSFSPLSIQGHNKTSTPKDDTRDKDNEISDFGSVKAAFEVPCPSDVSLLASNAENNYRGKKKKRRSSSCPHEGVDKNMHSKAVFFSPAAKLVKSPASCQPKRGTPLKGTKIPKFVRKMPDFTNIHKKEFEKMESVVDCHHRKLARAKMLFSPKATKGVQSVMVFTAQSSATKQMPSRNAMTQTNVFPMNEMNRNILKKADGEKPRNGRIIQRCDVKEIVTKKLPLQKKRAGEREKSRTVLRGVRLNRRFELQMAHRKLN